jgi:glutamyl-tRNA synthetase
MAEELPPRGRYAPSPTGRLHLGNARTALLAWLSCRAQGGRFVLRVEDLDRARVLPGAEAALIEDLRWLGLDWDEGADVGGPFAPYRQSDRTDRYDEAVARLLSLGRAFPCACSRAEVARAASAPHGPDDEGPRYPGTCRPLDGEEVEARARAAGRRVAIRFKSAGERIGFEDRVHGKVDPGAVDDFVLRRADGVASYQLAVVVDDAAMAIDEVVRGDDLLSSTPRQIALYEALGWRAPRFAHVPLLLDAATGERMAKRTRPPSLASLREAGWAPERVVGCLAASAGLSPAGEITSAGALLAAFTEAPLWPRLDRAPVAWRVE